ncbi:hypothetical protein [Desulfurococcus amylolyticus]|uniref:Uncharacterized protein n=1 Tax=Desulfurococcus amylolyticus DSM 16532 TaxID=768672 RepID=I3XQD4_DESAM|nr:hypothetical protein [Desulfurococcus amylolyticus]AFL66158.1 hypothetical protein Desfe_0247 [Desulfurococcus amylolyticus DSM 16532]
MTEVLIILGVISTIVYTAMSFTRLKLATAFRDFTAIITSLIAGVSSTMLPTGEDSLILFLTVFFYITSLWFYGVERQGQVSKRLVNPASSRILVGVIAFVIATWIVFSKIDSRLALIIILSSLLLGAYRLRTIEKVIVE